MRITKIISQHRRDFYAEYVCEHCKYTEVKSEYDDDRISKMDPKALEFWRKNKEGIMAICSANKRS